MFSAALGKLAALLGLVAAVTAQGVTQDIFPPGKAPEGCAASFPGRFEVTVVAANLAKRDEDALLGLRKRRECGKDGVLVISLTNSVAKDALSRTGYIASNYQFQFDAPAQAGALYTAGFSLCKNGFLALGNSTQFWQCKSGDFWNLYDRNWAAQCDPVVLKAMPCGPGTDNGGGDVGQIVGTTIMTTTIIRPIPDGQPQVITTEVPIAMCQIGDGQIQKHTTPCASLSAPLSAPAVSQITDGQIQVPPKATCTPPPAAPPPPPRPTYARTTPTTAGTGGVVVPPVQPTKPPTPPTAPNAAGKAQLNVWALLLSSISVLMFML